MLRFQDSFGSSVMVILWPSFSNSWDPCAHCQAGSLRSMEWSPSSEHHSRAAGQHIPRVLWHPKIHYRFHNSPPLGHIPVHLNAIHAAVVCLFSISFNRLERRLSELPVNRITATKECDL
jgi:hypothetical protein